MIYCKQFTAKYVGPTDFEGSKIIIESDQENLNFFLSVPFDSIYNGVYNFLEKKLEGLEFYISCDNDGQYTVLLLPRTIEVDELVSLLSQ